MQRICFIRNTDTRKQFEEDFKKMTIFEQTLKTKLGECQYQSLNMDMLILQHFERHN